MQMEVGVKAVGVRAAGEMDVGVRPEVSVKTEVSVRVRAGFTAMARHEALHWGFQVGSASWSVVTTKGKES